MLESVPRTREVLLALASIGTLLTTAPAEAATFETKTFTEQQGKGEYRNTVKTPKGETYIYASPHALDIMRQHHAGFKVTGSLILPYRSGPKAFLLTEHDTARFFGFTDQPAVSMCLGHVTNDNGRTRTEMTKAYRLYFQDGDTFTEPIPSARVPEFCGHGH